MRRLVTIAVVLVTLLAVAALAPVLGVPPTAAHPVECADFDNQAEAQEHYRDDPANHRNLDRDGDGLACENRPCPCDETPVEVPEPEAEPEEEEEAETPTPTPTRAAGRAARVTLTIAGREVRAEAVPLVRGCNNVALTWPTGTPIADVVANIRPAEALTAIWRLRLNVAQGFSPAAPGVSDLQTVNVFDAVFICVNADATLTRPVIPPAPPPAGSGPQTTTIVQHEPTVPAARQAVASPTPQPAVTPSPQPPATGAAASAGVQGPAPTPAPATQSPATTGAAVSTGVQAPPAPGVAQPAPAPAPVPDVTAPPPTTTRPSCCRVCTVGKACGNSCINVTFTCHQPPGCACNAWAPNLVPVRTGFARALFLAADDPLLVLNVGACGPPDTDAAGGSR